MCSLAARSDVTCKRTGLPLAWRSSHPRRRPPRFRSGRICEGSRRRRADFRSATIETASSPGRLPAHGRPANTGRGRSAVRRACSPRRCSATCKRSARLALCSIPGRASAAAPARISCAQDDLQERGAERRPSPPPDWRCGSEAQPGRCSHRADVGRRAPASRLGRRPPVAPETGATPDRPRRGDVELRVRDQIRVTEVER